MRSRTARSRSRRPTSRCSRRRRARSPRRWAGRSPMRRRRRWPRASVAVGGSRVMVEQDPRTAVPETPSGVADAQRGELGITLQIPTFEGPLDLLLHLIERNELDITEVSLLAVAEQYLEQLRRNEHINIAALADFVAMGARLLLLKSRALLPHDEAIAAEGGDDDGARDLVEALKEYRR